MAKHCPEGRGAGVQAGADDATLVYTPPRRHKFVLEKDRAVFAQRVRAFKHQSRKSHQCATLSCIAVETKPIEAHPGAPPSNRLQPELYKPMLEEVLAYLVWAHGQAKALMVRARDVRLAFRTKPMTDQPGTPNHHA